MRVRHATFTRLLPSILRSGLLGSKSRGRRKVVWVCSPARSWWALLHVVVRHGGVVQAAVVLELDVPRQRLVRSGRKGLWYVRGDVGPERIRRVLTFTEMAAAD